ncbi:unnamed protein product [Parascedosporium putredinis]|uniref:Uncharacterized protein n=1 Tax=Parascedosporium putredinis TaxID=1442378 RepID=A0A9P1GX08_9PEZI|nr:unnamed protein product [Parascedosporium putredinis]CAI7988598.1 unnamed protein product [Parascedosporium putredinis]
MLGPLQEIWDSYRTGHKRGIPGLALDLALDKTLGGQVFLHLPGIYLGILYRTKRAASLQLKALQGLQNKPDPSFGEEENVDMEKLCDINSKIMEDYALLSHLNGQRVPSKYDISRVERLTQFYSDDSDYKTPFQGRRDLHRALNKGDFVLDVVKWMFNHRVRHLLVSFPVRAVQGIVS